MNMDSGSRPPGRQNVLPFTEPWQATALRTVSLALAVGVGIGVRERRPAVILPVTLLALWFTLGGHFFELLFRNRLRRHISDPVALYLLARVVFWIAAGALLFEGALATRSLIGLRMNIPFSWWQAGIAFAGVELLIHLGLRMRGLPSVYDGRG